MGLFIKQCDHCNHAHGRLTKRCLEPRCPCHEQATVKVSSSGLPMRPTTGTCPSCRAPQKAYCHDGCHLYDPCGPQ